MRISTLAFANLRRRKGKAILLGAAIAIGIGTVVALLSLGASLQEEIGAQLDRFGANILVLPKSNSLALDYGGVSVPGVTFDLHQLKNADVDRIREIPYRSRLSVIAPKLLSSAEVEGHPVLLTGVDFKNELKLRRWWNITGQRPSDDDDVLVGYEVARSLSLIRPESKSAAESMPGRSHHDNVEPQQFTITRQDVLINKHAHHVAGVLAPTGGPEDRMIFGSLPHVQALVNKPDQLSLIEVSALCKGCPIEDIVAQIRSKLPGASVTAIQQAVRARTELVSRLTRFSAVLSVIVLVIGALLIFTTMMGSVLERTREIGVLRAIGFRRTHIMKGLILEIIAISLAGGVLGWISGLTASWMALPYFSDGGVGQELHLRLLLLAVVAALAIGTLSSIYPAMRASRLDPSEAVRYM